MKKIVLFLCISLFYSCVDQQSESQSDIITIKVSSKEIPEIDPATFIKEIRYLKIDSDGPLFSDVIKIEYHDSIFYILDRHHAVYAYNMEGGLLFCIDYVGHGPGEYISVADMTLDPDKQLIHLLDRIGGRIHQYSMRTGEFRKSIPLNELFDSIHFIDSEYLANRPMASVRINQKCGVFLLDSMANLSEELVAFEGRYPVYVQDIGVISPITPQITGILCEVESAIYHYENRLSEKKYLIDFEKKKKPIELPGGRIHNLSQSERDRIGLFFYYKETNSHIFFASPSGLKILFYVYVKAEHKLYRLNRLSSELHPMSFFLKTTTPDMLFCTYPVYELKEAIKSNPSAAKKLDKELLDYARTSKEEDNPIIQIIYLNT